MNPHNFPGRKLHRQQMAKPGARSRPMSEEEMREMESARQIRTKKDRRKL